MNMMEKVQNTDDTHVGRRWRRRVKAPAGAPAVGGVNQDHLPNEVLLPIMAGQDSLTLCRLAGVSRHWRLVANHVAETRLRFLQVQATVGVADWDEASPVLR